MQMKFLAKVNISSTKGHRLKSKMLTEENSFVSHEVMTFSNPAMFRKLTGIRLFVT